MIRDYFTLAIANISHRRTRSFLTVIGIFIGIAAITALIALGQGLSGSITQQFEKLGKDKITIYAAGMYGPTGPTSKPLTQKDVDTVAKIHGVQLAGAILLQSVVAEAAGQTKLTSVVGYPLDRNRKLFEDLGSYEIAQGRELRPQDTHKVVLGSHIANGLFDHTVRVGQMIKINGRAYQVVGIFKTTGSPEDDNDIYASLDVLRKDLNMKDAVTEILVQTDVGQVPANVADAIKEELRKKRGEKKGSESVSVSTAEQLQQTFQNIFGIVQAVVIGLASISLIVGGIGIMNTMYTAVLERTKEIGIMKAVGARNGNILTLFLIESGMLGLIGGLIGLSIGYILGQIVQVVAQQSLGSSFFVAYFPPELAIGALSFSFIVGTLSGALPALNAAKLKPVDALRYE